MPTFIDPSGKETERMLVLVTESEEERIFTLVLIER